ncbi:hypothetical protein JYU14_00615 [Simkania negevensis]|uniref:Uncharacterized protein n=1 Tax=Simkania negevensis TaxID=83561 RepID=A0ABS3AQL8_9BACT|nr:hypothetical protein [Simkania negevensis]
MSISSVHSPFAANAHLPVANVVENGANFDALTSKVKKYAQEIFNNPKMFAIFAVTGFLAGLLFGGFPGALIGLLTAATLYCAIRAIQIANNPPYALSQDLQQHRSTGRATFAVTSTAVTNSLTRVQNHAQEKAKASHHSINFVNRWRQIPKYKTEAARIEHLTKEHKKGTCYGQFRSLLEQMSRHHNAPSQQLVDNMKESEVLYYQTLHTVACETRKELQTTSLLLHYSAHRSPEELKEESSLFRRDLRNEDHAHLDHGEVAHCVESIEIKLDAAAEAYASAFNAAVEEIGADEVVAGKISLPKHAMFFQLSDNNYRFYDTFKDGMGFYEFATKEEFFTGLQKHLNGVKEHKGSTFNFEIYGIKKKKV